MRLKPGERPVCRWCGITGHTVATCHVRAERRTRPDPFDQAACELVDLMERGQMVQARRLAARTMRRVARRDA